MFCSTDSTGEWENCHSDFYTNYSDNEYKSEEEDLWVSIDRREWREYLKTLWLGVLRMRQYFNIVRFSKCLLYYRRLLFSVSGWLARKGHNKKN